MDASWKKTCLVGIFLLSLAGCRKKVERMDSLDQVRADIRAQYKDVPQISTDTLADWLKVENKLVLVDVREKDEYEVSHLPGARWLPPGGDPSTLFSDLPRSVTLVAYCSVGYRSSDMVRRLREAGFSNVYNLDGSIFKWAGEGKKLAPAGQPRRVHPYNEKWGRLLDESLHPPQP